MLHNEISYHHLNLSGRSGRGYDDFELEPVFHVTASLLGRGIG